MIFDGAVALRLDRAFFEGTAVSIHGSGWDSLGYIHHHLGRHTQAKSCYEHAIDLYRGIGDRYNEAATFTDLGDTLYTTGDAVAARTAWQQALTILDHLHHPDADHLRAKVHHR